MATLTIELDDDTLRKVERAAEREHLPVDRWASEHLAEAAREKTFSEHLAAHAGILADTDLEVPSDDDMLPLNDINLDED
ncbi:MAG: hypothetical protein KDN19_00240 [Verrucomicrobiae bacterium]|nr:hypothetical protein [Verrucomicrobiae bacterium]